MWSCNGHVLTGHMWRRKKAGVLAARLMLGDSDRL